MTLLGLAPLQLALLLGGGTAALTTLYLLRQKKRRIEVPFVKLWLDVMKRSEVESWWRKLLRWLSLLIQVVVLGLLVLALGDPRLGRSEKGRTLVLLIDASASMQATVPGEGKLTRLDLAKRQAGELVRGLGGDDLAVVVALDGQPAPMGGLSYEEKDLLGQIAAVVAQDTSGDLPAAADLSRALLTGRTRPQVVLFSDGGYVEAELGALGRLAVDKVADVRFVPLPAVVTGGGGGNGAVTALAVRRYRRNRLSYEVLTRLVWFPAAALDPAASQGARKQRAALELLQDGEVVDVQQVELVPGQAIEKIYGNLSGAGRKIEARLRLEGAVDVLGLDDRAFAVLPERRTQRVLLVTAGNLFLEGALLATGAGEENHVKIERIKPAAYTPALAEAYDVVVFDAVTAKAPANTHVLYLHPEGDACPFAIAGVVNAPIITDVDASHPVMRWVALGDVNMMKSAVFNPQPGDRVLASMLKQPLMVARQEATLGGVRRSVAIGMDLRQSDLPLRVAFPVLLMNALDWFAGDVDDDMGSRKTGQFWRIPLRKLGKDGKTERVQVRAGATAVLVRPDGVPLSVPVSEGFALHYGQKVGFYEIRSDEVGARQFAANLSDPRESQITVQRELSIGGVKLAAPAPGEQALKRTLWPYLLLLVMAIFALEWWSYHRRVTV